MTKNELDKLRGEHVPVRGDWCLCGEKYPCTIADLVDALDSAEGKLALVPLLVEGIE